jgi:hypothetical protein
LMCRILGEIDVISNPPIDMQNIGVIDVISNPPLTCKILGRLM